MVKNVPFSTFMCFQVGGGTDGGRGAKLRLKMVDVQVNASGSFDGACFLATSHVQSRMR